MKRLLPAFLILLSMACQQQAPRQAVQAAGIGDSLSTVAPGPEAAAIAEIKDTVTIGGRLFTWSPIDKSEFDAIPEMQPDTSEAVNIAKAPEGRVVRSGDSLIFSLINGGRHVVVNNHHDGDDFAQFTYQGFIPELQHWLVLNIGYEWFSYDLISARTGALLRTIGIPQFSPDKKYFIAANADLVAQFNDNGFELYEVRESGPVLVQEYQAEKWGPAKIKWKDANTFYAEIREVDTQMEETIRHVKFSLQ
ncbi:hypothetical protein [Chitinophaga alhagiae]|uniref:hypothetical protein n=1 Tax=Chitinophaga alhagiae TaxID=2203219 RepID=UPI000E5B86CA|nr:hypothetical protein [Chitinophaga alhagiae]